MLATSPVMKCINALFVFVATLLVVQSPLAAQPAPIELNQAGRLGLVGGNLGSRMLEFGLFETEVQLRNPGKDLVIRNLCDGGDTPGFRPHSSREPGDHWAFPGAKELNPDLARTVGKGFNDSVDEWLTRLKVDMIVGFFGFSSAFSGQAGLPRFEQELTAFIAHTRATAYNGNNPPQLAIVSPIAFQDRSADLDVPSGLLENVNIQIYTESMRKVCAAEGVRFVDLFTPSKRQFDTDATVLTTDGMQLNEAGYAWLNPILIDGLFGSAASVDRSNKAAVHEMVTTKNWCWKNDYKIPNGVHVHGRRYNPFGPDNYPAEIEKIRQMTDNRDQAIWAAARGARFDLDAADAKTRDLPAVNTNYKAEITYRSAEGTRKGITMPEGYEISTFADEARFPDLANPVQMAFDNQGRLWVAVMPSYPHWRPGDELPNDKLLILEDRDGDNVADHQSIFADNLHLPMGFELHHDGVFVAQGTDLCWFRDTDNDGKADSREVVFSGFDDHDTHHSIGAFCVDPSGALLMAEGVFLNTNVETPYGTVRGTDGGFYRFDPKRRHLERALQVSIPNPWGIAFDEWGQGFYLHTSGPALNWMTMYRTRPRYGHNLPTKDLLSSGRVRPTSGLEFVSSRHFPEDQQGDVLLCNNIGYQGIKQHKLVESESGYQAELRHDLFVADDRNVRPVDLEFAPDGSLYVVDWHNGLVGHMQHNARDPNRDHVHGRILRITAKGRPLLEPATIAGADLPTLFANLTLPEYRSRYRTRRELRGRDATEVLPALTAWVKGLDASAERYEHHLLEALWVTWGFNKVDEALLRSCLAAKDHKVRAGAVNVLHYNSQMPAFAELLTQAASDSHGRVLIEVASAASWQDKKLGLAVLDAVKVSVSNAPKVEDATGSTAPKTLNEKNAVFTVKPDTGGEAVRLVEISMATAGTLNLCEIEIFSDGKNIAKTAKGTMSSTYNDGMKAEKMVDGNKSNFAHTRDGDQKPWIRFAFNPPVKIDELKLYNRQGYEGRVNGSSLLFKHGEKTLASYTLASSDSGGSGSTVPGMDEWLSFTYQNALLSLNGRTGPEPEAEIEGQATTHLKGADLLQWKLGREIYAREGHCGTCHQPDGKGLPDAGFPPLDGTKWVLEDEERLAKITLKGLMGPIVVKGREYPGQVPMTPFEALLNDEEIAAVLTYVRNSFGNKAAPVKPETIAKVRAAEKGKAGFYRPEDL